MAVFASLSCTVHRKERSGFCASEEKNVKCLTLSDRERGFVPLLYKPILYLNWLKQSPRRTFTFLTPFFSCIWFCSLKLSIPKISSLDWQSVLKLCIDKKPGSLPEVFLLFFWYSQKYFWKGRLPLRYPLVCKSHKVHTSRSITSLFSDKWSFEENQLLCQQIRIQSCLLKGQMKDHPQTYPFWEREFLCLEIFWLYTYISYINMYAYTSTHACVTEMPCLVNYVMQWSSLLFSYSFIFILFI